MPENAEKCQKNARKMPEKMPKSAEKCRKMLKMKNSHKLIVKMYSKYKSTQK